MDAGVGALWMSPIFKSPMYDFGYDISDFYDIQDEYGTMADFDELVRKAHELGKFNFIQYKMYQLAAFIYFKSLHF